MRNTNTVKTEITFGVTNTKLDTDYHIPNNNTYTYICI